MATIVERLRWDEWNVVHIARHEVTPEEVEEVCQGNPMMSGTHAGRLRAIGKTRSGKMLTIILAPEGSGIYYTVTARPASKKERRCCQEQTGGV